MSCFDANAGRRRSSRRPRESDARIGRAGPHADDGASIVSYLGHGSINLWADEKIFHNNDIPLLSPQSQQPFVLTMNCLNGFFTLPYFDALGEKLVTANGRGAIATFSPSGLSLNEPAKLFHKAMLEALTSGEHLRLGDRRPRRARRLRRDRRFPGAARHLPPLWGSGASHALEAE